MEIFQVLNSVPYLYEGIQLALAGHALAIAIVNLTPTPKDDDMVKKVYGYIELAAGLVTKKAKQ